MEPQETHIQETDEKVKKTSSKWPLILVLIILIGALAYIYVNSTKKDILPTNNEVTVDKNTIEDKDELTQDELTQDEPASAEMEDINTVDIDKDLESFDSLDLTGIENDYSEDTISDLE